MEQLTSTEIAYQLGYRCNDNGELTLNGEKIECGLRKKSNGRHLRAFTLPGGKLVYLSKLMILQKYGKEALNDVTIYVDGNTMNCSKSNVFSKNEFAKYLESIDMYYCTTCNQILPFELFYPSDLKSKDNKHRLSSCKKCINKRRKKTYNYIYKHKESGCMICGEKDPACLDFHHLGDKYEQLSHMQTHSMDKIKTELQKCVVLCSNCHRKLHYYNLDLEQLKKIAA